MNLLLGVRTDELDDPVLPDLCLLDHPELLLAHRLHLLSNLMHVHGLSLDGLGLVLQAPLLLFLPAPRLLDLGVDRRLANLALPLLDLLLPLALQLLLLPSAKDLIVQLQMEGRESGNGC